MLGDLRASEIVPPPGDSLNAPSAPEIHIVLWETQVSPDPPVVSIHSNLFKSTRIYCSTLAKRVLGGASWRRPTITTSQRMVHNVQQTNAQSMYADGSYAPRARHLNKCTFTR